MNQQHADRTLALLLLALLLAAGVAVPREAHAQSADAPADKQQADKAPADKQRPEDSSGQNAGDTPHAALAKEQARLSARFEDLKKKMLNLAELTGGKDRRRAAVLRQAVEQSQQQGIEPRMIELVKTLRESKLGPARDEQRQLNADLQQLLELLLKEDRAERIDSEKKQIQKLLQEVGRIIKQQRGVKARTEGGDDLQRVLDAQQRIAQKTGELEKNLGDGKQPGEQEKTTDSQAAEEPPGGSEKPGSEAEKQEGEPSSAEKPPGKPSAKQETGKDAQEGEGEPSDKEGSEAQAEQAEIPVGTPPEPPRAAPAGGKAESQDAAGKDQQGEVPPGTPQDPSQQNQPGQQQQGKQGQPGQEGDAQQSPPEQQAEQPQDSRQRVHERVKLAQERMEDAEEKLKEAQREGAGEDQQAALENLEQAKAELEKILRQLREEEVERVLADLEDRFKAMLQAQLEVNEATQALATVEPARRGRDDEIEAGRLSRRELEIVREADRALTVLRADGSGAAFPETVGQMREDMQQVADRLAQVQLSTITVTLQQDIVDTLNELIAALKQAQQEMKEQKEQQQNPPSQMGQPGESALLDMLAELRLIRSLQLRINKRHKTYAEVLREKPTAGSDLLPALRKLAEQEERIRRVTRDLDLGKNR